jgi:hypothetical protein
MVNGGFLGVGWSYPVRVDGSGGVSLETQHEEKIRQAIWIILATARGERVMRPDFGCGIHDLVFAVNSAGTGGWRVKCARHWSSGSPASISST